MPTKTERDGKKGLIIIKTSDTNLIALYVQYFPKMRYMTEMWVQMGNVSSVGQKNVLS